MRVAIFTETFLPKTDGIVRVVCLLLDHLKLRGIEAVVVAPRIGDIHEYNGFPVLTVPAVTFPLYPELKFGPPTPYTYRDLVAFKPDIAHFIHPVAVGIPGMMMAKLMGIPTLASFHIDIARMADHFGVGFLRGFTDFATRTIFNWADYSLAPSKLIQNEMRAIGIHNVGLWKRGVDARRFNPSFYSDEMRYRLSDGHPDAPLLLYVGRLSAEKQVSHLRAVLDAIPEARLAIVGDGPERHALEEHFAGRSVHFAGYMQGEQLSQAYASADIFTFPSALETFGLVVVEAMAAGLPVVSSRVGGIPDVVEEGVTGFTFEVGDTEGLIAGVRQILATPERLKQMGQQARAFAETQSWEAMMDEVIAHYERLIAQAHDHHRATA
ncbi:MAG: glycosyltransferase family 1 protein [Anaerolineae bacterium]